MSPLVRLLKETGALDPVQLEAAFRRQQIYGGSFDTVLLELELLTPARLDELLSRACGLPSAPVALLAEPRERTWSRVPRELVDLGWAMPLGIVDGRMHVAVHADLGDEKLALLRRSVPGLVAMVTAECCLAKLASERTGCVIPQRYAILALSYVEGLRRAARRTGGPGLDGPATPAPWMSSPAGQVSAPPGTVPPGTVPPARVPPVGVETTQTVPAFPAPPRGEAVPVARTAERTSAYFAPPPVRNPHVEAPVPEPPPWQAGSPKPTTETNLKAMLAESERASAAQIEVATPAPPTMQGSATLSSEPVAEAWHEQFAAATAEVEAARERDAVTEGVLRAAMLLSPRVALFGVKKEGLRGLAGPGAIPGVAGAVIPPGPRISAALAGQPARDRVSDLDLRVAVGQETAVPCLLVPIRVRGRAVLLLYVDRDGLEFGPEDLRRAEELAEAAGRSLDEVLRRMSNERTGGRETTPPTGPTPSPPAPEIAPRVPRLVEPAAPVRFNTLVGQGASSTLPPERPVTLSPTSRTAPPVVDVHAATAPGISRSPLRQAGPLTVEPDRPPKQVITLSGSPAPPAGSGAGSSPRSASGITPLSIPLTQGTARGQLVFEEEAVTEVKEPPPSDSIEARIDACLQSAMGGGASAADVLRFGDKALLRVAARFPGPIDVFRRDLDSLPAPAAHGPLIRLTIQLGEAMVPYLLELMDHQSPNVRFYAAFVFQALRDDRCIHALGERAFDADADVRAIATRVLETYNRSPSYVPALGQVRQGLADPNITRQVQAVRALGTLRDIQAVPHLIELLASRDRYVQEAALEALCSITGQQLGLKPQRWRKWYAEHGTRHRVEWIMSALSHRDVMVRRWAAEELRRITGQDIDFPAAADQALRDAALRRWLDWWEGRR